ncbi:MULTISPECIES: hypothetical protein [unclassified Nostoc]|nr:hypothetical protein [Nostoc sp. S13]MDF5734575.1 hypothetical protein [Nostoc sp. S13]
MNYTRCPILLYERLRQRQSSVQVPNTSTKLSTSAQYSASQISVKWLW